MSIRAVLFDMNGIIIDDEHIHEAAYKRTVETFGINLDHESYLVCCAGKTDKEGYESIGRKYQKSLPINQLLDQKAKEYLSLFPIQKCVYPGILECIDRLSKNYTLGLTSSSIKWEVELITKEFKIADKFKVTITGDDVKNSKPDPEPYLLTCKLLNVKPAETVVIEDSASGIKSAISAGCKCIGITTTHSSEQLILNNPTTILRNFDQINTDLINAL